jgi:membrane associated rhomboid family serine protease
VLILPYGHDRYVYSRPWATIVLIGLNVLAFAAAWLAERGGRHDVEHAVAEVLQVLEEHPGARVPPATLASLPPRLREVFAPLQAGKDYDGADGEGEFELRKALRRMTAAAEARPSVRFGYRPGRPGVVSALTSLFMHGGLAHLLGNMLFLWLMGAVIESFWSRWPFLLLYLGTGAAAALAHHLSRPDSLVPLIGASGAIAGLMGAFVMGHPRSRIKLLYALWLGRPFLGTTAIPAWTLIPAWFLLQVGYAVFAHDDGTAYWAHVGGFVAGLVGTLIVRRGGWITYDASEVLRK